MTAEIIALHRRVLEIKKQTYCADTPEPRGTGEEILPPSGGEGEQIELSE